MVRPTFWFLLVDSAIFLVLSTTPFAQTPPKVSEPESLTKCQAVVVIQENRAWQAENLAVELLVQRNQLREDLKNLKTQATEKKPLPPDQRPGQASEGHGPVDTPP